MQKKYNWSQLEITILQLIIHRTKFQYKQILQFKLLNLTVSISINKESN